MLSVCNDADTMSSLYRFYCCKIAKSVLINVNDITSCCLSFQAVSEDNESTMKYSCDLLHCPYITVQILNSNLLDAKKYLCTRNDAKVTVRFLEKKLPHVLLYLPKFFVYKKNVYG